MTPLVLDLCCGRGGWADAFLCAGWNVLGVDVRRFKDYPAPMMVRDIRSLVAADYRGAVDLVVASPPCTEFSKYDSPGLFPDMEPPDLELVQFCFEFARACHAPLVLENVRGLQRLIGQAVQHYGSFYLWGDGVPPLMPYIPGRAGRPALKWKHRSSSLRARIPFELAYTVAQFHTRLLENRGMAAALVCSRIDGTALAGSCVFEHARCRTIRPEDRSIVWPAGDV